MQMLAVIHHTNQLIADGRLDDAIDHLGKVLEDFPNSYDIWLLLSKCYYNNGEFKEALNANQRGEKVDPFQESFTQIQSCIQNQDFHQATQLANSMLNKLPQHPRAVYTLAHISTIKNDPYASIELLENGLQSAPANTSLRNMLTNSYASAGYFAKALQAAKTLVKLDESFESLWILIGLQFKYGQYQDLLISCERAALFIHDNKLKQSQLELMLGQTLRIMGRKDAAIQALQDSIAANPKNADAWWALADMKDYVFSDSQRTKIKILLNSLNSNNKQKSIAAFAYAKASETKESANQTMVLYKTANDLATNPHYSPRSIENEFRARMQSYTKDSLGTQAKYDALQIRPIFIMGLPRAGSTLLEQILASHSLVTGTIEQPTLPIIESRAHSLCMKHYNLPLATGLSHLSQSELTQLGQAYLDESAVFRHENTTFFIDKQPFNFRLAGFIHKILPQAIMIDVRRNPLDCGLSLYKQYFHSGVDFSYRLSHIATVYKEYLRLMAHWDTIMPEQIYKQQYEALIMEPEGQIRALLDTIGIKFEESCLHFYNTKRSIHTASSEQVRQPIHKNAIGAWRKFETALTELKDELGLSDSDLSTSIYGEPH